MSGSGYRLDLEDRGELVRTSTDLTQACRAWAAPLEIDPRPWHRIENQGSIGSCQGHALSSVCEMAYHIATGDSIQFSRLFGYYATQKIDGLLGRDAGSTINGGRKCAQQYGICREEVMPYPNPVRYTGQFTDGCYEDASRFKIQSHTFCRNYADVYAFLASGQGGVEIGISWGGFNPDREGVIQSFRPAGQGGHALCYLGYSQRKDSQGRNYLWLANSWSETWGSHGWAEVAPEAVDQMGRHGDTVMIGLSDLTTPEPRVIKWAGPRNPWSETP